jgi:tetratricopeptide (TPR) repeat protein
MTNQAFFYQQTGKYDKSVEGYLKALEFADSIGKSEEDKTPLLLGISTVYTYMGDYERSNYWWNRCQEQLPNMIKADQFIYYNDRGNDYYFQKKYDKARDCFAQAASLVKGDESNTWNYFTSITNLGEIYVCLGRADSARIMLNQADSFYRKVDFPPLLYYIETSTVKLEMLEGHPQKALQMIRNSKLADPQIPSARAQRLIATKQVMRETGNYSEAYEASHQLHLLSDSLQRAQISMQFSTKLMEYEHDKKLIEQDRIIEKTRADKLLAWALLAIALFAVAILLVLILFFRRRHKYNELQTRQQIVVMRMENIRNRITPHFIYNALNHEVLAQMEGRKVDLNSLTQLLRRGVELAGIFQTTLAEELNFVDYYIDIEGRQMGPDFKYYKEIADDVDSSNVYLPSMIVQIFAENALKHGLRPIKPEEGRLRKLTIRVSREQQATLVEVMDNGNGLQSRMDTTGTQTGSRVVRQTIQMLNENNRNKITFGIGNWKQDGESGCRSWILLPDNYNYQLNHQDF